MGKLLLLSPMIATILIPALAARTKDARRGAKLALFFAAAYFAFYVAAMRFLYPRLM